MSNRSLFPLCGCFFDVDVNLVGFGIYYLQVSTISNRFIVSSSITLSSLYILWGISRYTQTNKQNRRFRHASQSKVTSTSGVRMTSSAIFKTFSPRTAHREKNPIRSQYGPRKVSSFLPADPFPSIDGVFSVELDVRTINKPDDGTILPNLDILRALLDRKR